VDGVALDVEAIVVAKRARRRLGRIGRSHGLAPAGNGVVRSSIKTTIGPDDMNAARPW